MRATLVVLGLVAGCSTPRYAMVHGQRVERPSFGYTDGSLFAVQHHRAYPDVFTSDRPFHVDDGELSGNACGLDLQFFSEWYGNLMTLSGRGFVGAPFVNGGRGGVTLTVAIDDYGGGRTRIHGGPIDIDVSADRLVADLVARHVELRAEGHYLVGRVVQHTAGTFVEAPFVIYGREMLGTMVPADKALILIFMLTCNSTIEYASTQARGFSLVSGGLTVGAAVPLGPTEVIQGAGPHDAVLARPIPSRTNDGISRGTDDGGVGHGRGGGR